MTREEWEKQREEALKKRRRSKFTAAAGDFTLVKPAPEKDKDKGKEGAKDTE